MLLFAWFVTWIAFALTPALGVPAHGTAGPAAPAVVLALAQYSTDTPDDQCVDGTVFDAVADPIEVSGNIPPAPSFQCHPRPIPLDWHGLDPTDGVRPTSPAARALALPLQGHMTRLRI